MHFKKYFLLYTLIPLFLISTAASYYRFMISHDYIVEYEGNCDPEKSNCFVGCDEETTDCTDPYYYTVMSKNASFLREQCGSDITNCESAQICLPSDAGSCSITYCDGTDDTATCDSIEGETAPTLEETTDTEPITESNI